MEANENTPPPYSDVPKTTNKNPYHAGYDQPWNQGYIPVPQGAMMIQQTMAGGPKLSSYTIVVTSQPQPTFVIGRTRGSDLSNPSILVCFFCCWVTGIPAMIYAMKAQNEYSSGNWDEAERNQACARGWIIISLIIPVTIWLIILVWYFTVVNATYACSDYNC